MDGQTFAIQNLSSGKDLRPFEAGRQDGNRIVLYGHHAWKCLTWTLQLIAPDRYQLTNYYTGKRLSFASSPDAGVLLVQHATPPNSTAWDLVVQSDDSYAIRMAGTELYISATSEIMNSSITLTPFTNADAQKWRLLPQKPWF
jgi:hypothetical protein